MESMTIARYQVATPSGLVDFTEMIRLIHLRYNTGHLVMAGVTPEEITMAINKAIQVCQLNGIDPAGHFHAMYVFNEKTHNTYYDWRMSRQGFALVLMNVPPVNSMIARWQWEMVNA
jgi:hypothetical protein